MEEQFIEQTTKLTDAQIEALQIVKDQIATTIDKDFIEEITKSNITAFSHEDVKYRITKPNYQDKQTIYKERVKKFTELLRDDSFTLEKDLKKLYLKRGIDIDGMAKKITSLETKKEGVQYKLGEVLKKDGNEKDCETYKKEIQDIQEEQKQLAVESSALLEFTIENQVMLHMYNYMTYVITEKEVEGKFVKAFESFQKFMEIDDDALMGKLAFIITMTYQNAI